MEEKDLYDVVVIGGGPAGLTAALYLARARYRVVVLEKDRFGGQITITEEVVNYPGIERTSGEALVEAMRRQAEAFGAEFLLAEATGLDMGGAVKTVRTTRGDLRAFGVLLATGAHPRRIGFPGEERFQGRGVAYCATCDGEFFTGKEVFVVGGGFAAAEESVFLTKYASHVTILVRKPDFTCAPAAAEGARSHPKISVLTNTEVVELGGVSSLEYLRYRNNVTGEEGEYRAPDGDTFGVFVFAGYEPETALLEGLAEVTDAGYAVVDARQQTTVPGLFAAGDVCEKSLRQVVTATGDGALAATELERYVAAMQKETGLVPVRPASRAEAAASNVSAASGDGGYLDPEMRPQLDSVFGRMEAPLVLELHLDDRPISEELRGWMDELAALTDKLSVVVAEPPTEAAPCVRVLRDDGADTGVAFHGVPGGHEFTSFVLGLYNASGPGQPIDEETRSRIAALDRPVRMDVLVSLSCTNCPDVVQAAQRIAADSPNATAHAYDINHFPELKDRYNAMSVPCLVISSNGEERVTFGRKGLAKVLDDFESLTGA